MRAEHNSPPTPTADIIRDLEAALNGGGLAHCHCHGPHCEEASRSSGPPHRWDREWAWQRAFAVARARLSRLALRWSGGGGTEGQLTLPGLGGNSLETLAQPPGRRAPRDQDRRAGNGIVSPQKVGRSR